MPLQLSPTQIAFNARGDGRFNRPFAEQVAFFRQKINMPTERYDDALKSAHDRAFVVAGAMKADLLQDLRDAIDQAIRDGKSIGWFRKEFERITQKHGWLDYTGSETQKGRAWRTRVIYRTNIASSYAAGRYQQLKDPDLLKSRPYWKYVHNDTVEHPRPLHVSWSGLVLRHDDPWWDIHYPPNGWGCRCQVVAVTAEEYHGAKPKDEGVYTRVDSAGNKHVIPKGIDFGWDYAPGQSNAPLLRSVIAKQDKADWHLARDHVAKMVGADLFARFFNGKMDGEFPIAVLSPTEKDLLGAESQTVLLSRESIDDHIKSHPEITVADYRLVQQIIDQGEIYQQGEARLIYIQVGEVTYRAVLKRTADGLKNYFLTLFKNKRGKPPKNVIKIR